MSNSKPVNPNGACIEKGEWTPLPAPAPHTTNLAFTPSTSGNMAFHMTGCSGDPKRTGPGLAVAAGMAGQLGNSPAPAFLYHLGDIAYTDHGSDMTPDLWNTQFFAQFAAYKDTHGPLPIFAIAGNHDGKAGKKSDETAEITFFLRNMCGTAGKLSPDNKADPARTETAQPYPYWRLDTPLAYIIGLHANVSNGGALDDPLQHNFAKGPQYQWLVQQLSFCRKLNAGGNPKAILLALHYPPYNGAADFAQRGNPTFGADNAYPNATPIAMVLQSAYTESGQTPDAVFSAHAHLYQRMTVNYADTEGHTLRQVPHFVVGCGGHSQLELMTTPCDDGIRATFPTKPFNLFTQGKPPANLTAPPQATVMVENWADGTDQSHQPYGFLRVTLTTPPHPTLVCEFFATPCDSSGNSVGPTVLTDACVLDLTTHLLK